MTRAIVAAASAPAAAQSVPNSVAAATTAAQQGRCRRPPLAFSPQTALHFGIAYYGSLDGRAFDGNAAVGIGRDRNISVVVCGDVIGHF